MVVVAAAADGKGSVAPWAGVPPTRKPDARAPKPINFPSQRLDSHGLNRSEEIVPKGTAAWGNKSALPSSNEWGSPWLLDHKNDGAFVSPSHMDDRPSSRGSSTSSSTSGSDFLDLPSHHLPTAASRPLSTETRSGSLQLSRFPDSFTNVLKAPFRNVGRRAPTSQGKGFSLSLDDFPELGSKNSTSNSQQGQNSGRCPTVGSGMVATQDEQGKNPITGTGKVISSWSYEHESISRTNYMFKGGDPIPAAKLTRGAEQAQLHGPKGPNICMPPPWVDYWHPPPDQPPDEDGILHRGEAQYGPYKNADPIGFPAESLAHFGQSTLNEKAAARQHTGHGGHFSVNRDPSHPHMPADCCAITQPCHVLVKVKNGCADVLEIEKQPIIKKDLALLEKIKCLNIKARNLRALNLSNTPSSLPKESKVEHPKSIHVEADHTTEYVPFSAVTSEVGPAFDKLNSVSESTNSVPTNPSNVPAKGVVVGLSEEQVTEYSEPGKAGKSANCHAYGRGDISGYGLDCSAQGIPSNGHGWEEYPMVDSSQGVVMTDAQQDQLFSGNTSQQAHVTAADKVSNWLDCEFQHSRMRYLSSQAAKQLHDAENWISQQKANAITKLEELRRYQSIQSHKSNDAPPDADNLYCKQKTQGGGTTSSTAGTHCVVSADGLNAPQPVNGVKATEVSIGSSPASNTSGVIKGPWIHNVMSSAKKTEVNMIEYIANESTPLSHDNNTPEHLWMENRRRHFDSRERNMTDSKTLAGTKGAEAKSHEDLLTRNKNIMRDTDAIRPAATLVFGNQKNSTKVSSVHKTAINSSTIPAKVTSVTGLIVGSIMIEDVSLASVNPEWAAAAKEVHDTATSLSRLQQVKKSEKNQHGLQLAEDSVSNDSAMCKTIKQTGKKEVHAEGCSNGMAVAAATEPSENHSMVLENVATTKKSEVGWYAHELLHEELQQQNGVPILPGENQTSYGKRENSNLETKYHDKEAPASSTEVKVTTELNDWLDRKTTLDYQGRPGGPWKQKSDGLASRVQNVAEPADYFNVANVVQKSSDQWQQGAEQFESKTDDGTVDHSKQTQMVPWPDNTWVKHRATDYPRRYHVEGQRNAVSRSGYEERASRGHFFHESPAPSRLRWMPKYTFHPPSDAQDNGVSEWLLDSHQIAEGDGGVDLQGGEGNVSMSLVDENLMIWNEKEWEYQQPFPAPHRLGQQQGGRGHGWYQGRGRDTDVDSQRGRGRHSEYHFVEPIRYRHAAPDIQWNLGGADNHRPLVSPSAGVHMQRRYYI